MRKLMTLAALAVGLLTPLASWAFPLSAPWEIHATNAYGGQIEGGCGFYSLGSGASSCSFSLNGGAPFSVALQLGGFPSVTSTEVSLEGTVLGPGPFAWAGSSASNAQMRITLHDDQGV